MTAAIALPATKATTPAPRHPHDRRRRRRRRPDRGRCRRRPGRRARHRRHGPDAHRHGQGRPAGRSHLRVDGRARSLIRRRETPGRRTMVGPFPRQETSRPMPHVATSPADLLETIRPTAHVEDDRLVVDDEAAFRATSIRDLAWTAAFSDDPGTTGAAQWLVWEASQALGAHSASIQELYAARGRGEVSGFTVPAINLRAQTFDLARTIFETAMSADVGAVILEIARSEQTYTFQRPIDFATSALAGAIAAGWRQPVFLQGDHYQFNAKKYAADPEAMTEEIRRACRLAVEAGYRNIDIDSSTLVDLSKPTVDEQQRENYVRAAELTALIRDARDRRRDHQRRRRDRRGRPPELDGRGAPGLHGRLPPRAGRARARRDRCQQGQRPDRHLARWRAAARRRRRRGQARLRRARASSARSPARTARPVPSSTARRPCPTSCSIASRRSRRPRSTSRPASRTRCTSTRPSPRRSTARSRRGCYANAADERKADQTDQQFVYTTRKKAIGPFKRELWDLETKDEIMAAQRRKIGFLFTELGRQRLARHDRRLHPTGRGPPTAARRPARGGRRAGERRAGRDRHPVGGARRRGRDPGPDRRRVRARRPTRAGSSTRCATTRPRGSRTCRSSRSTRRMPAGRPRRALRDERRVAPRRRTARSDRSSAWGRSASRPTARARGSAARSSARRSPVRPPPAGRSSSCSATPRTTRASGSSPARALGIEPPEPWSDEHWMALRLPGLDARPARHDALPVGLRHRLMSMAPRRRPCRRLVDARPSTDRR